MQTADLGVIAVVDATQPDIEPRPPLSLRPAQIAQIIDSLADDPLRLRRLLARLAADRPDLAIPDAARLEEDLTEALRRARSVAPRAGPMAERRYRTLELLIVEHLTTEEAADAQFVSRRSVYRYRQEGTVELTNALEALWGERYAAGRGGTVAGTTGSEAIPRPRLVVGRDRDVQRGLALLDQQRLLVVGGPAGVGKTVVGAAVARHLAATRPVMWHRFRPALGDTIGGLLYAIGQRLAHLGVDALSTFLRQASPTSSWEMVAQGIAAHSIQDNRVALFFDDADVIVTNDAVVSLILSLHSDCPDALITLMARERLPLGIDAQRLELTGLDPDEVRVFLSAQGLLDLPEGAVATLADETGGNPQLLHLASGALLHGELDVMRLREKLLDVPDIQAFFFDQIYRHLSDAQRLVLSAASLMREPATVSFLAAALEDLAPSIPATIAELARRFLLSANVDGLRLHSSVRQFASRTLSPSESALLHRHLAQAYADLARSDEACHHWIEAGEADEARRALLAAATGATGQARHRVAPLVERLHAMGLGDDPDVARLAASLAEPREGRPRR